MIMLIALTANFTIFVYMNDFLHKLTESSVFKVSRWLSSLANCGLLTGFFWYGVQSPSLSDIKLAGPASFPSKTTFAHYNRTVGDCATVDSTIKYLLKSHTA